MKVVYINSFNCGSTGNLMLSIAEYIKNKGDKSFFCCPSCRTNKKKNFDNQIFIGTRFSRNLHLKMSQFIGINGIFSGLSTFVFLRKLDEIKPDIIHINNLHNCYVNIPMLFKWIKKRNLTVVWTLHDCWSFTAYCAYFSIVNCNKWERGCFQCPQYRNVMSSSPYIDNSLKMWRFKKKWFTGVKKMQIISPSRWLSSLVQESFLNEYPNKVIYNGVDLKVFHPKESSFRIERNLKNKYIILGIASEWGYRKGLDIFVKLSEIFEEKYQIVLVGIDENMKDRLPPNILCISKTANQEKLAEIYSDADVFVNPTREEVFGLVNIEALACGTPVVTFNSGGSPETIDETCGYVVSADNINRLIETIKVICENHPFPKADCVNRAKRFNIDLMCERYYQTYLNAINGLIEQ